MSATSLQPSSASSRPGLAGLPLFSLGFRPFYLLAGLAAVLTVPSWLLVYFGLVPLEPALPATLWHLHEMLFGFVAAVLVGFLYTAVPNWTGRPTPKGAKLAGLAALWLLGRIAMLAGGGWPPALVAAVDVAFLPLAALGILLPLWRAKNRRNIAFPFALFALAAFNLCLHLAGAGFGPDAAAQHATRAALGLVTVVLVVMTARVVPFFTGNALPHAGAGRIARLDAAALAATIVSIVATAALPETAVSGAAALAAGALLLARMVPWKPLASLANPMVWVLHLGSLWIAVSFLLRGAFELGVAMQPSLPDHALTVGAVGGLTLGMMARSALGHSGRRIQANAAITASFVLINVAAWARSLAPLMVPAHFERAMVVASVAWTLAFLAFLWVFVPILVAPRADAARQA
jgi:uncharacterized protein involved in response to NO